MAKDILFATGTKNASGDNELIAAPAGNQRIVLVFAQIQNESAVATTVIMKAGATAISRKLLQIQGDSLFIISDADARVMLPVNTALNANLSGANSVGYSIEYYVE